MDKLKAIPKDWIIIELPFVDKLDPMGTPAITAFP